MFQTVALLVDLPEHGLRRGQVGVIVEELAPKIYEVEFSDTAGRTYAQLPLKAEYLMALHHAPEHPVLQSADEVNASTREERDA